MILKYRSTIKLDMMKDISKGDSPAFLQLLLVIMRQSKTVINKNN